jgi:hypothetical protein
MNWEPVLTDLFSEFPVVENAAAQGTKKALPTCLQCLWLLVLRVMMHCSCVGLLW